MRLVVDTGPLIALSKTGHLDLLPRLFDNIVIPAAVLGEIAKPGDMRPGSEIQDRPWMETRGVSMATRLELQKSRDIAAGEAEAILITARDLGLAARARLDQVNVRDDAQRACARRRSVCESAHPH
jgi:predicted nucleic acid-binding protein